MKFLIIVLFAMTSVLASCGKENPLSGKPRGVQEGENPDNDTNKPTGDKEEALRIITQAEDFEFVEKSTGKYLIEGQVFIPGATFELRIENLTDFPGATFDGATGIFEWTPASGFVDTIVDKEMKLNVIMFTNNLPTIRRRNQSIKITVSPVRVVPEIVSIQFDNNKSTMREGESANFAIVIRDVNGVDVEGGRPTISISVSNTTTYQAEDANMISFRDKFPTQDKVDKSLWTYNMKMDLWGREVTTSQKNMQIKVTAISRFQVASSVDYTSIMVFSSLKEPVLTWSATPQFRAGAKNSFTFSVFDPRGEGDVQFKLLTNCASIHPNLKCDPCTSEKDSNIGKIVTCPISWDIPSDYFLKGGQKNVIFNMELFMKATGAADSYQTGVIKISRAIQVLPPEVVSAGGK